MLKYYYDPFKNFDPFEGEVDFGLFNTSDLFPELIDNARLILAKRSSDDIRKMVDVINFKIDKWFQEQEFEIMKILEQAERFDLLYVDERGVVTSPKIEAMDEYDWPRRDNVSPISALEEMTYEILEEGIDGVPNLIRPELFAAQALSHIGDFVLRSKESFDIATGKFSEIKKNYVQPLVQHINLSQYLLNALHGLHICLEINSFNSLQVFHQKRLDIAKEVIREELKIDLAREHQANTVQAKKNWSKNSNITRHAKNNQAKKFLQDMWEKNPTQFSSAEKAVDYYSPVMQENDFKYSHRVMTDWIRERARQIKVKFR